jgi:hypothetical protein
MKDTDQRCRHDRLGIYLLAIGSPLSGMAATNRWLAIDLRPDRAAIGR